MGREFQKGNILLLKKHLEERQEIKKKKNPTTHGGVLIHQESNLFKENLLIKKKNILSVLNVFNKNIEPPHVSNGTGCCHFWCQ